MKKSRFNIEPRLILRLALGVGFLCLSLGISAQTLWEGNAAVGAYGILPVKGLYGASNSFPRNTLVEVENLENGKKTEIIIVDRLDNSNFLMLLSQEAGASLAITSGTVIRVRASLGQETKTDSYALANEQAYHPDPDVNPAAAAGSRDGLASEDTDTLLALSKYPVESEALDEEGEEVAETAEPKVEVEPVVEPPVVTEEVPDVEVVEEQVLVDETPQEPEPLEETEEILPLEITPPVEERLTEIVGDWDRPDFEEEPVRPAEALPSEPVVTQRAEPEEEEVSRLLDLGLEHSLPAGVVTELPQASAAPEEPQPRALLSEGGEREPRLLEADSVIIASAPEEESLEIAADLPAEPEPEGPRAVDGYRPPQEVVLSEVALLLPEEPALHEPGKEGEPVLDGGYTVPDEILLDETVELVMTPAEPRPPKVEDIPVEEPEVAEAVEPPKEEDASAADKTEKEIAATPEAEVSVAERLYRLEAPLVEQLEPGFHYIQLGVFGDERGASAAVSRLEPEYPVLVWFPEEDTRDLFKVMVGPLMPDESGTLLYLFKAGGYRDAFLRKM